MTANCTRLGGAWDRPSCEPRPVEPSVKPGATYQEVWGFLKLDAACSREFRKIWSISPRQVICMDKPQKTTWVGPKVGWDRVLGNHQSGANGVIQVDGASDTVPTYQLYGCVEGGLRKNNNGLCQHFCLGESSPSALALVLDKSFPSHLSLMPFNLLPPCCSSEGVSSSLCMESLGGTAWDSRSFCLPSLKSCWFLQPEIMRTYLHGTIPWAWESSVALGPVAPEIPLLIFIHHTRV